MFWIHDNQKGVAVTNNNSCAIYRKESCLRTKHANLIITDWLTSIVVLLILSSQKKLHTCKYKWFTNVYYRYTVSILICLLLAEVTHQIISQWILIDRMKKYLVKACHVLARKKLIAILFVLHEVSMKSHICAPQSYPCALGTGSADLFVALAKVVALLLEMFSELAYLHQICSYEKFNHPHNHLFSFKHQEDYCLKKKGVD